jgi:glycosyltransferase involved in cell wall biosynthesis
LKNITILCNTYPPDIGAAPGRLHFLAKYLIHKGFNVKVITSFPHYPAGKIAKGYKGFYKLEMIEEVPVHRFWLYAKFNTGFFGRIASFLSLVVAIVALKPKMVLGKSNDLFIVQTPPVGLAALVYYTRKLHKKPYILNVSDLWPEAANALGVIKRKSLLSWFSRNLMSSIYKNGHQIFVQSGESEMLLGDRFPNKVQLLRTGFDPKVFKKSFVPISSNKDGGIIYYGVLGIAHDLIRVLGFIDFSDQILPWRFFGNGVEEKSVKSLSEKYKSVDYYPMVPHKQLIGEIYRNKVVFICQGKRILGTLPSKIYDAMACGRPILYLGDGEGAELVKAVGCGWVVSAKTPEQINPTLEKIGKLGSAELNKIGKKGHVFAWKYFRRDQQVENVIQYLS